MDKNTFIKELEQALSVLQEDELKDIISEYEQHIDLRVQNGLSEEEAIRDFGSMAELTSDILSAYHVRPDYTRENYTDENCSAKSEEKSLKSLLLHMGKSCEKAMKKTAKKLKNALFRLLGIPRSVICRIRELVFSVPVQTSKTRQTDLFPPPSAGLFRKLCNRFAAWLRRIRDLIMQSVRLCFRLAVWIVRFIWNAAWIGLAALCSLFGLFSLFSLGVVIILRLQQYPLTGILIICLGMVLCMFSAAGLSATFVRNPRKTQDTTQKIQYHESEGGQHA